MIELRGRNALTSDIRKSATNEGHLSSFGFPLDASALPEHHTPGKAVHLFAIESYAALEELLGRPLPRPAFGENVLAGGIRDEDICVGDTLRLGEARLVVTEPTERCRILGTIFGRTQAAELLHEHEICGFYAAGAAEGHVRTGDAIEFIKRLHRLMFKGLGDQHALEATFTLPALSATWKARLALIRGRHQRGEPLISNLADL